MASRTRTPKAAKAEDPPERVVIRWVDHSRSNPVVLDGVPRYLEPGTEIEVSAQQAEELAEHECFQVPSGEWTAPEPDPASETGETDPDGDADPGNPTETSADGRKED